MGTISVGVDIGGTFTDFVSYDPAGGRIEVWKNLSTPADPIESRQHALGRIGAGTSIEVPLERSCEGPRRGRSCLWEGLGVGKQAVELLDRELFAVDVFVIAEANAQRHDLDRELLDFLSTKVTG